MSSQKLQKEIDKARAEIKTDGYSMSIGEWLNLYKDNEVDFHPDYLYKDNEVDFHPDFQRLFRWKKAQKVRFIESILLGIPIPPIFVAQREDGKWEVVDGLQRLSTIFEFVGLLRDKDGKIKEPLVLGKTRYVPSLEGKKWDAPFDTPNSFSSAQRLSFKRARIDVSIIQKESGKEGKYELFQRLNTGGLMLSAQEIRNGILALHNSKMLAWLKVLAEDSNFVKCVPISKQKEVEQYGLELIFRFLVFRNQNLEAEEMRKFLDLEDFLTEKTIAFAETTDFDYPEEERIFRHTFKLLANTTGKDSFKRYDLKRKVFKGGFVVAAFEVIALGIGYYHDRLSHSNEEIAEIIKEFWQNEQNVKSVVSGIPAPTRIPLALKTGRELFRPKA